MDKKRDRGVALFISVLLHGLLALLPWQELQQERSRPLAVSSPPASPISVVDASHLPTLPASESQPLPAASSSLPIPDAPIPETIDSPIDEPAPEASWTPDAPASETIDSLIDEPALETVPDSNPVPAEGPSAVPSTPTPVTPADEAKFAADWEHIVGYLEDQDEGFGFTLFEIFDYFGKTEQVNQFFDANKQPKLDVSSFSHFPEQTPEQVLQTEVIPEINSNTGFELQPQENFAAGRAYQLLQGEMLRYLIIVRLREDEGSVLMLSESLAGLEP